MMSCEDHHPYFHMMFCLISLKEMKRSSNAHIEGLLQILYIILYHQQERDG